MGLRRAETNLTELSQIYMKMKAVGDFTGYVSTSVLAPIVNAKCRNMNAVLRRSAVVIFGKKVHNANAGTLFPHYFGENTQ